MSLALELLSNLAESYLVNPELEPHIVIDTERHIHVPEKLKRIGVQRDHNIETVTFDCPRYWDGIDLSTMYIYVNYIRADKTKGQFLCKNVTIDEDDQNIMHFDWTLEEHATLVKGKLRFLVCVQKTGDDGVLETHWNSELNDEMYISEGLECDDFAYEMNPAIITDLLTRMDTIIAATTPILDTSLTQRGLAADAKSTGDTIKSLANDTLEAFESEAADRAKDILEVKTSLAEEASDRQKEIAVERARINNIISGAVADDVEVTDIRIGADGKTYSTAGEAVREQISTVTRQNYHIGNTHKNTIKIRDMVVGTYYNSGTGEISNSDDYKRSQDPIPCGENILLGCQQKMADDTMMIVCYDKNMNYIDYRMILDPVTPCSHNRFAMTPKGTAYIGFNVTVTNTNVDYVLDIIECGDMIDVMYPFPDNHERYLAFQGYWVNGSGTLSEASNLSCVLTTVPDAEQLYVDQGFEINAVFFDANNNVISTGTEYIEVSPKGRVYDIPAEAKMVAINLSNTQLDMDGNYSSYAAFIRKDKKVLAIGDSITWLDNRVGDYDGGTAIHGWQSVLRKNGYFVDTLAYSGACISDNDESTSLHQYIVDEQYDVTDYDIIVLFAGANDVRLSIPFGDESLDYASPNVDPATFNGAVSDIIRYLRTEAPNAELYICTVVPRGTETISYETNKSYRDAIIKLAEFWCVPCIDLFTKVNVTPGFNFSEYFYDTVHPNSHGMKRIGEIIRSAML